MDTVNMDTVWSTPSAINDAGKIKRVGKLDAAGINDLIDAGQPAILDCSHLPWRVFRDWSLPSLVERFGDAVCPTFLNMPVEGPLADHLGEDYSHELKLSDFVTHMQRSNRPSYLRQVPIWRIPEMARDFDFRDMTPRTLEKRLVNVWIGSPGTKSTLHWDTPDNFLVQVQGHKSVILFSPEDAANMYPYEDQLRLSRTDPLCADATRFPNLDLGRAQVGCLSPGEALFLPQRWWHFMYQSELSISISCWFGQDCSVKDFFHVAAANSAAHVVRPLWDMFWLGLIGRPRPSRLSADVPTGKYFYNLVSDSAGSTSPIVALSVAATAAFLVAGCWACLHYW
jgi:hypothetical protein